MKKKERKVRNEMKAEMQKEIHVLEVVYTLGAGGIETFAVNMLQNMDTSKIKMDFAVIKEPLTKQFYDELVLSKQAGIIPVADFGRGKIYKYLTTRRDLYSLFQSKKYDIIHIHSGQVDKLPDVILARMAGQRNVIVHSHNQGLAKSVKFYKLRFALHIMFRGLYGKMKLQLVACSRVAAEWAFTKKAVQKGKVRLINNGLESSRYEFCEATRQSVRKELGIENRFVIGHVGRFNTQKNHTFLLDIFQSVLLKKPDAVLLLFGTGELLEDIKRKAGKLRISENIIFAGISDRIPEMLQAMDVFVFPSLFEGLPVVGIETQAAALHTIASDHISKEAAISEYWEFESLEAPAAIWAEHILNYVDGYERKPMGQCIRAAGYEIKEIAHSMQEYYEKLVFEKE